MAPRNPRRSRNRRVDGRLHSKAGAGTARRSFGLGHDLPEQLCPACEDLVSVLSVAGFIVVLLNDGNSSALSSVAADYLWRGGRVFPRFTGSIVPDSIHRRVVGRGQRALFFAFSLVSRDSENHCAPSGNGSDSGRSTRMARPVAFVAGRRNIPV